MGITCGLAELTAAAGVGKTDLSGKFYGRFYDGIRGDAGGLRQDRERSAKYNSRPE